MNTLAIVLAIVGHSLVAGDNPKTRDVLFGFGFYLFAAASATLSILQ